MKATTYILTGASSGMGFHLARMLLKDGSSHLIIGARDPALIRKQLSSFPESRLNVFPLDLLRLDSIRHFSHAVIDELVGESLIKGVICNAGIQLLGPARLTDDGIDETFATNFLGHALLVEMLRPRLMNGAKVVMVGSGTHNAEDRLAALFGFRGDFFSNTEALAAGTAHGDGTDIQKGMDRYATAKLCAIAYARYMAHKDNAVQWFSFDPGLMPGTSLARERSWPERFGWHFFLPLLRFLVPGVSGPERSANALNNFILLNKASAPSGSYLAYTGKPAPASSKANDSTLGAKLHEHCLRVLEDNHL
ncbi:SDR family NAD(P)-dependent oxidoreductase [Isoalcanivorax indicus]|uniref:SDR family NAD(P)-dependent oxidoreductase n=1 Tax=Isoalcanivorax indicus TaxID=2202653 RepID=UPI000DB95024|nr:SDR family NAD(P)-dependent oxidoreductase [Isoalcanivorax indicus]